jgi:hypothetical protein
MMIDKTARRAQNGSLCFTFHTHRGMCPRMTNRYFMAVASQGVMQVATIVIMARLATGI